MNPIISFPNISEEGGIYRFTLSGINLSLANSIRRTILSDIPTLVFYTETYHDNKCNISINTSRLHNEIIKHRLSCIPIHSTDLETLPDKYILEVDVKNDTETIMYVTTEDFRVRNKENGKYLTQDETRKIFPPCPITRAFIDFVRLRPKIGDSIPGEQIKLTCDFSISTAGVNSMFNVVSKCSYGNTPDKNKIDDIWEINKSKFISEQMSNTEIEFEKRNYYALDSQRQFIPDSFDFVIQSLGVFDNKDIVKKACAVLQNKFNDLANAINDDTVPIKTSETTVEFSYDITLENEDYTIGKVLEYILYEKYYVEEKIFSFCGFKKFHPHNTESIIRIAYTQNTDKHLLRQHVRSACITAQEIYTKIYKMF